MNNAGDGKLDTIIEMMHSKDKNQVNYTAMKESQFWWQSTNHRPLFYRNLIQKSIKAAVNIFIDAIKFITCQVWLGVSTKVFCHVDLLCSGPFFIESATVQFLFFSHKHCIVCHCREYDWPLRFSCICHVLYTFKPTCKGFIWLTISYFASLFISQGYIISFIYNLKRNPPVEKIRLIIVMCDS